jgi:hypothetical protein
LLRRADAVTAKRAKRSGAAAKRLDGGGAAWPAAIWDLRAWRRKPKRKARALLRRHNKRRRKKDKQGEWQWLRQHALNAAGRLLKIKKHRRKIRNSSSRSYNALLAEVSSA